MTPLLAPFALVYASLVRARNARFDRMAAQRLRWPVVSIGNLSVGGAGKTPLVICLARLLEGRRFSSRRFIARLWAVEPRHSSRG